MKKILLGSATLLIFSLSIIVFQFSCRKDSQAQNSYREYSSGSGSGSNRVLYIRHQDPPSGGMEDPQKFELRAMKLNGSNDQLIVGNAQLDPFGYIVSKQCTARSFNNGEKILFTGFVSTGFNDEFKFAFFTCNADGSNIVKIKEGAINETLTIQDIVIDEDHDD